MDQKGRFTIASATAEPMPAPGPEGAAAAAPVAEVTPSGSAPAAPAAPAAASPAAPAPTKKMIDFTLPPASPERGRNGKEDGEEEEGEEEEEDETISELPTSGAAGGNGLRHRKQNGERPVLPTTTSDARPAPQIFVSTDDGNFVPAKGAPLTPGSPLPPAEKPSCWHSFVDAIFGTDTLRNYLGKTYSTMLLLLLLGVGMAFYDYLNKRFTDEIAKGRTAILNDNTLTYTQKGVLYVVYVVGVVWVASAITFHFNITARGSGIPQLKVILSGFEIDRFLAPSAFIVKAFCLCLIQGVGMYVGKIGPYVHISAALAEILMGFRWFQHLRDVPATRQQILSTAAAVGVTAAIRAPIGGLLFAVEATCVSFLQSNYWKSYLGAMSTIFAIYLIFYRPDARIFKVTMPQDKFLDVEFIFYAITGVLGGLLGAFYVRGQAYCFTLQRWLNTKVYKTILWRKPLVDWLVIVVAFLTAISAYLIGPFMRQSLRASVTELYQNELTAKWNGERYPDDQYLSIFLFGAIVMLLNMVCATLPFPAGIIFPTLAVGAAMGRLMGRLTHLIDSDWGLALGGYAMVGSASFCAGVTRSVSCVVILCEAMGSLSMSVPMLLGAVIAIAVGNLFTESAYDAMLRVAGLPYLPNLQNEATDDMIAKDIMVPLTHNDQHSEVDAKVSPVLPRETTVDDILWVLQHPCPDYPDKVAIVDSMDQRLLLGYTTRDELKRAIRKAREILYGEVHQNTVQRTLHGLRSKNSANRSYKPAAAAFAPVAAPASAPAAGTASAKETEWLDMVKSPKFFESYQAAPAPGTSVSPQHTFRHLAEFIAHARAAGNAQETQFGSTKIDLYDFNNIFIVPSPFQVTQITTVPNMVYMMASLHIQQAFVTDFGRLAGVITSKVVQRAVAARRNKPATAAAATKAIESAKPAASAAAAAPSTPAKKTQDVELVSNSQNNVSPRRPIQRVESIV